MPATTPSRRRLLATVPVAAVGGLAGCLSEDDRALPLAFVRLVNSTFEHERTIDLTLTHDGETVLDERYEDVPPSRSPRAIVGSTGPTFGFLPGGSETVDETFSGPGTDLDDWPRQLPEAHTITLDGRDAFDEQYHPNRYSLSIDASPPEFADEYDLGDELSTFEDRNRAVEDDSRVGLVVDFGTNLGGMYPNFTFYAFETAAEQQLLESYLDAELERQSRRERYGAQTVEDSPFA
ncbi:hypothetical protein [Halovivax gelatinilyticus]|uniref:hypothetical protein n=1 Tax=Halovivax gelatinilyticus TaxID=2961597 RepID=UPI0020CA6518|nr:hypothetical protein [Halovivax gelatinilyticus]